MPDKYEDPLQLDMTFEEALERFAGVNTREVEEEPAPYGKASPFVKWAGGKRSIISELEKYVPEQFGNYYEAFVGGGAMFFHLQDRITKAFLSDINFELVLAYNVIKHNPDELIASLKVHKAKHNEEYYYKVRDQHDLQDPIKVVSRFLYLNKTCYNGLYRVNKKGRFNTPMGRYKNPDIVPENNIKLCTTALQEAEVNYWQFDQIEPQEGDFVYFDPPYVPLSPTSSFTSYNKNGFGRADQERLAETMAQLTARGVKVMLSNSSAPMVYELHGRSTYRLIDIQARRSINSKAGRRGPIKELLILNY